MKKQMKDIQNEIKQNIQGTKSDSKETRTQSKDLEQKKTNKKSIHSSGEVEGLHI